MTSLNRHAHLLSAGTGALWRRYGTWLLPGTVPGAAQRLAGMVAAGWMLAGMVVAAPVLMWPMAAAWLVAAWRTGRELERREKQEAAFVQLLRDLIGERNGVLLAAVLTVLLEHGHPDMDVTDVRAQCEALDIPVRDKIKVAGDVSVGVHVDDLTTVWDVHPRTTPPTGPRTMHAAVTSDNYPTTPSEEGSGRGDVDHGEPVGEVSKP